MPNEADPRPFPNLWIDPRVEVRSAKKGLHMTLQELEAFKHFGGIRCIGEEAVLIPYTLYLELQKEVMQP